jgi:hypothetical protein
MTSHFPRRNRFRSRASSANDERIFKAHDRAVRVALKNFEDFAATRVRIGGARSERLTGNFAAALFTHDTSRALDPHLHTHCIVFNATLTRWKIAGRRWKITSFFAPENLPRTPIITNSPATCGLSATRFATGRAVIFKSKAFLKNFASAFPNGVMRKLTRRWQIAGRKTRTCGGEHDGIDGHCWQTEERTRKQRDLSRDELAGNLWESQLSEIRTGFSTSFQTVRNHGPKRKTGQRE